jgi:predicted nuclease with TOPRIM domain
MDNWQFAVVRQYHDDIVNLLCFSSELIKKYSTKCKENENLQKQLKQLSALLKEYQDKLINAVTKQMPLEEVRNVCAISTVIEPRVD